MNDDSSSPAGRDFVVTCYEVVLGREVDAVAVVEERGLWPVAEVLRSFLCSAEFETSVYRRLAMGRAFERGLFVSPLRIYHRYWVLDRLPVRRDIEGDVLAAASWRELLACLVADVQFMRLSPLAPLTDLPIEAVEPEDGPEPFAAPAVPFDARGRPLVLQYPQALWN